MVSLGPDNSRRHGGIYFDTENSGRFSSDEELLRDDTALIADLEPKVRSISTTWAIVLELIILIAVELITVTMNLIYPNEGKVMKQYSLIVYIHSGVWVIVLIIDRYWRWQHYLSRRNGYLEFYRKTRHIRRVPFLIYSAGAVILGVVLMVFSDECPDEEMCGSLSKLHYLQIVISIENFIILPFLLIYLTWTVTFNKKHSAPDACQYELMTNFLMSHVQAADIGFRDDDFLDDVLEKQADMIRYLWQRNAALSKKIVELSIGSNSFPR